MRILRPKIAAAVLIAALIAASVAPLPGTLIAYAAEPGNAPSEQSLKELFAAMQTRNMLDTVLAQTNETALTAISRATEGRSLTDEQKRILSEGQTRVSALVREQLAWTKIEPAIMSAYRDTFTQQEIDGMLRFYRSPAGQAMVAKMPEVMHKMMQQIQTQMQILGPKVAEMQRETAAELQSASKSAEGNNSGNAGATPPATPPAANPR
jgi:uncharacterized protein